jgi:exodeoxyribonuclease VII large subunit
MQTTFDLDPPRAAPVLTVTALNQQVARLLERSFPLTWIGGEISNFTRAASGHWYFTLKDDGAQVRAVMFRGRAQYAGFVPREGDKVEVRALVTLYGARGDYQINVEAIRRAGVGQLFEAFQRLKETLGAQGLFDPARKRALPLFPRAVGIVTSPQAAALRDVLTALRRRAPHVRVVLYPAPVQGQGAAERIAAAIDTASRRAEVDLLLVCRGGGAIEDLWSFNEEVVARAIVAASMASLSGDAADLRRAMRRRLADANLALDMLARRVQSPAAQIGHQRLRLVALATALGHATRAPVTRHRGALAALCARWARHRPDVRALRADLLSQQRHCGASFQRQLGQRRAALAALAAQLELLNPQRTLERGYAIVRDASGAVLRSPAAIVAGAALHLRLADGSAEVAVASVAVVP